MSIFVKLKERYILDKKYNIMALRAIMYFCVVIQLIWTLMPVVLQMPVLELVTSFIIAFISFSFAYVVGYLLEVFLFYIIFKKYLNNSLRTAEKQVAPLLFLKILVPFIFNLIGYFLNIPSLNVTIKLLQFLIVVLYMCYLVFGDIFKEKCIMRLFVYLIGSQLCEGLAILMKMGINAA